MLVSCSYPPLTPGHVRNMQRCILEKGTTNVSLSYDGWYFSCNWSYWYGVNIYQSSLIYGITNFSAQENGYELTLCEKWNNQINEVKEKSK
jgi:hypothetical protein